MNGEDTLLGVCNDDATIYGGDNSPTSETEIQSSMDERYGIRNGHYNLRPQRE